jgi:hypothetical protein
MLTGRECLAAAASLTAAAAYGADAQQSSPRAKPNILTDMTDLLSSVSAAHGGLDRWHTVRAIDVTFNFSGGLLDLKGYPGHRRPSASVDTATPRTVFQRLGDESDERWIFTPNRVWIERRDGTIVEERSDPRAAFAGHVRETPWDRLHLTYFLGYAVWNYLTTPFLFARTGFTTRELESHVEGRETWRVLEVTYPDDVPAHTKVQTLYFGDDFMLRRLDYVTDVLGGVAAHYCYDLVTIDGLVFPTLRRVVRRTPEGPLLSGRTAFILDYTDLAVRK